MELYGVFLLGLAIGMGTAWFALNHFGPRIREARNERAAFDAAMRDPDETLPFDQAVQEIEEK